MNNIPSSTSSLSRIASQEADLNFLQSFFYGSSKSGELGNTSIRVENKRAPRAGVPSSLGECCTTYNAGGFPYSLIMPITKVHPDTGELHQFEHLMGMPEFIRYQMIQYKLMPNDTESNEATELELFDITEFEDVEAIQRKIILNRDIRSWWELELKTVRYELANNKNLDPEKWESFKQKEVHLINNLQDNKLNKFKLCLEIKWSNIQNELHFDKYQFKKFSSDLELNQIDRLDILNNLKRSLFKNELENLKIEQKLIKIQLGEAEKAHLDENKIEQLNDKIGDYYLKILQLKLDSIEVSFHPENHANLLRQIKKFKIKLLENKLQNTELAYGIKPTQANQDKIDNLRYTLSKLKFDFLSDKLEGISKEVHTQDNNYNSNVTRLNSDLEITGKIIDDVRIKITQQISIQKEYYRLRKLMLKCRLVLENKDIAKENEAKQTEKELFHLIHFDDKDAKLELELKKLFYLKQGYVHENNSPQNTDNIKKKLEIENKYFGCDEKRSKIKMERDLLYYEFKLRSLQRSIDEVNSQADFTAVSIELNELFDRFKQISKNADCLTKARFELYTELCKARLNYKTNLERIAEDNPNIQNELKEAQLKYKDDFERIEDAHEPNIDKILGIVDRSMINFSRSLGSLFIRAIGKSIDQ